MENIRTYEEMENYGSNGRRMELMSKNNFYVIGGQYEVAFYGGAPTLIGAKRLASKCIEYWDNWGGEHRPKIYRAEDTVEVITDGMITYEDGHVIRVPKYGAEPVC